MKLLLLSEFFLISFSYFYELEKIKYLIYVNVVLSASLAVLIFIQNNFSGFKLTRIYSLLILSTLIYSTLLRGNIETALVFLGGVTFLVYLYYNGMNKSNIIIFLQNIT